MARVRVNGKNQIVIPAEARKKLGIKPGDSLIIDVQDGSLFIMKEPDDHVEELRKIGEQIFRNTNGHEWLQQERDASVK